MIHTCNITSLTVDLVVFLSFSISYKINFYMWYSSDLTMRLPNKLSGRTYIAARWATPCTKLQLKPLEVRRLLEEPALVVIVDPQSPDGVRLLHCPILSVFVTGQRLLHQNPAAKSVPPPPPQFFQSLQMAWILNPLNVLAKCCIHSTASL